MHYHINVSISCFNTSSRRLNNIFHNFYTLLCFILLPNAKPINEVFANVCQSFKSIHGLIYRQFIITNMFDLYKMLYILQRMNHPARQQTNGSQEGFDKSCLDDVIESLSESPTEKILGHLDQFCSSLCAQYFPLYLKVVSSASSHLVLSNHNG